MQYLGHNACIIGHMYRERENAGELGCVRIVLYIQEESIYDIVQIRHEYSLTITMIYTCCKLYFYFKRNIMQQG